MKISNLIKFSALAVLACSQTFAMTYFSGLKSAPERNLKYSTCQWGSSGDFETPALPGKPGKTDTLFVRWGGYKLDLDANVDVLNIAVGDGSSIVSKGKTINAKRGFSVGIPGGGHAVSEFDNCQAKFGGNFSISFWDDCRNIGTSNFILRDTTWVMAGTIGCIIPAYPSINAQTRGGFTMTLEGKTQAFFGEGTVIDTIFREKPEQWAFKLQFVEKDGHVPALKIGGIADFTGCDLEIKTTAKLETGTYNLIEFTTKSSKLGALTRMTLNGQTISLGQTVDFNGKKITISEGPIGRLSKSDKNIIMTVK